MLVLHSQGTTGGKEGNKFPHHQNKISIWISNLFNILPVQDMVVVVVNLAFNFYRHSNPLILGALSLPNRQNYGEIQVQDATKCRKKSTGDLISRVTQRPHWHPSGINKTNNIKNKNKKPFSPKTVALPWLIQCIQFSFFHSGN